MSSNNGNGNGHGEGSGAHSERPLDAVRARIASRTDEASESGESDLHAWKERPTGTDVPGDLARIHSGLLSVAQCSEAAIEGGLLMALDVKKLTDGYQTLSTRIDVIGSKTEANARSLDQIDRGFQKTNTELAALKVEVEAVKAKVEVITEKVELLPVMKEMLADLLSRLPAKEPEVAVPQLDGAAVAPDTLKNS